MKQPVSPVVAAGLAAIVFVVYRVLVRVDADPILRWAYAAFVLLCLTTLARGLVAQIRWSMLAAAMRRPSGLFGRVAFATAEASEHLGLSFSNEDGDGIPLGGIDQKIIYYKGSSHISVRAPNNAGKTESSAAPICYALGAHRNIIATAKGAELAWLCGRYRREVLKQNVIFVDPWRLMKPLGLPSLDFNPIGHFPARAERESPDLIDKAFGTALMLTPETANGSGDNRIFRNLAREICSWFLIQLAIEEAETGELRCNLPTLKKVLGGSNADLQRFLSDMRACQRFDGSVARAAARFIAMTERSPKLAESIVSEALSALTLYDPAGPLGRTTEYSDFDPRDLKTPGKAASLFIVVPPEKTLLYGPHIGLCLNALIDMCIEADRFEPRVTVVADEFAACGVLPSALPTLYLGRSRGVQLVTYVQDTESYGRYGKEGSAFTTQSEIVLAWSIRSTRDAEEYSKRSGQRSIVTESVGASIDNGTGRHSVNLSEKGIPNLRPDEFLQLPERRAALFYRQNAPLFVDLVSYRSVAGWREHAKPMPGAPPLADLPVIYRA